MTRHTPETVRAACERAGIRLDSDPWKSAINKRTWFGREVASGFIISIVEKDGTLWYDGEPLTDRYHPNELRAETMDPRDARIVELEERVRALLDALDAHEDANGDVAFDYHEDHAEAIYIAKAALRDAAGAK